MKPIKYAFLLLVVFAFSGISFALVRAGGVEMQPPCVYKDPLIIAILPTIAIALFVLAGITFAAGHAFGDKKKATAKRAAAFMAVGGVICIVLAVVAPVVIYSFVGPLPSGVSPC